MARNHVHFCGHSEFHLGDRVRLPKGITRKMVEMGLSAVLAKGVKPGPELDVPVILPGGITAILRPQAPPYSGWMAVTFLDPSMVTREQIAETQRLIEEAHFDPYPKEVPVEW